MGPRARGFSGVRVEGTLPGEWGGDGTLTCPAGEVEPFEPGAVVHFDPEACGPCKLRPSCTQAASGKGRSVMMGDDERLQQRLRSRLQSRAGRAQLRERVGVELPQAGAEPGLEEESPAQAATVESTMERTPRLDWAGLLRRTFALDVFCNLILRHGKISRISSMAHLDEENLLTMMG